MCRLMAYIGQPTCLADVVLWPDRSIIKQSYDARERLLDPSLPFHLGHGNLNGDGFGIGWYSMEEQRDKDPTPCVFTSITPAWNNENLSRLACKIISPLMFAHVRAAYPGMPVSEQNCHPFMAGRYLFMHNGVVGGFARIKRSLLEVLSDDAYNSICSFHSDSAVSFALFLHHLPNMQSQHPPEVLIRAMQDTISCISRLQRQAGVTDTSLLNYVVSDGTTLIATRYVYPETERAASLYYAEGDSFERSQHPATQSPSSFTPTGATASHTSVTHEASYSLKYGTGGAKVAFVASEPITASSTDWVAVPRNTALVVIREKDGYVNILRAPLAAGPEPPHASLKAAHGEVALSLEAVSRGITAKSRELWQSTGPGGAPSRWLAAQLAAAVGPGGYNCGYNGGGGYGAQPQLPAPPGLSGAGQVNGGGPVAAAAAGASSAGVAGSGAGPGVANGLPLVAPGTGNGASGALAGQAQPSRQLYEVCTLGRELAKALIYDTATGMSASARPSQSPGNGLPSAFSALSFLPEPTPPVGSFLAGDHTSVGYGHTSPHGHFAMSVSSSITAAAPSGTQGAISVGVGPGAVRPIPSRSATPPPVGLEQGAVNALSPQVNGQAQWWVAQEGSFAAGSGPAEDPHFNVAIATAATRASFAAAASAAAANGFGVGVFNHGGEPGVYDHLRLTGHAGPVLCMVLDEPGARLYSASVDCTIKVWSLDDNSIITTILGHKKPITHMRLLDGFLYASGGRKVRVWDVNALKCVHVIRIGAECGTIRCLEVRDRRVFMGCQDTTLKAFRVNPQSWKQQDTSDTTTSTTTATTTTPSAAQAAPQALLIGDGSRMVRVPVTPPPAHAAVSTLSTSPTANERCTVRMEKRPSCCKLRVQDSMDVGSPLGLGGEHSCMEPHPQEEVEQVTCALEGHVGAVNALALWGPYVASAGSDAMVRVWGAEDLKLVNVLRGHRGSVLCLLALGHLLISGARDNTIRVWDMDMDMMCCRTLTGHQDDVTSLCVVQPNSPCCDGPDASSLPLRLRCSVIASSSADGTVRLWSRSWACLCVMALPTLPHLHTFGTSTPLLGGSPQAPPGHAPAALCSAISCGMVVAGYADGEVRMWHTETLAALHSQGLSREPSDIDSNALNSILESMPAMAAAAAGDAAEAAAGGGPGGAVAVVAVAATAGAAPSKRASTDLGCVDGAGVAAAQGGGAGAAVRSREQQMEQCLRDFVRIRTVSSNVAAREECLKGARYLSQLLEGLGAEVKMVRPVEDKNPVVIGRLGSGQGRPTITFYGHYDVQPASEPDWASNPFELNAVNEYLYGRGTSDNKGPIIAFIFAVKELIEAMSTDAAAAGSGPTSLRASSNGMAAPTAGGQAQPPTAAHNQPPTAGGGASGGGGKAAGGLPFNLVFVFEGEEENGSIGFKEAVSSNLRWFENTQLIVISNTNWVGENLPCITYGMRGMISMSISVSGPARDVHSGNDGGVFNEPMTDLIKLMGTVLEPGSNRVRVPGFYDNVAPGLLDLAWCSIQSARAAGEGGDGSADGAEEFSFEGYRQSLGVPSLTCAADTRELLEKRWCQPSLSVVDLRPGQQQLGPTRGDTCYRFGPTRFSVIPCAAVAKVSARFVPNQDAKSLVRAIRSHVQTEFSKLGSNNKVSVQVESLGNWWEADHDSRAMSMLQSAINKEWNCKPLFVREGGTMPVARLLEEMLGAPAIMMPMGQASDAPHLANERIRRSNLFRGKNVIRRLLEDVLALARDKEGGLKPGDCLFGGPASCVRMPDTPGQL